ncbi:phospholipase B1, membrane-associated-like [Apis laboriosa]|uniref:phospholipase B1, membrane-associated-like n=1 Tax=Apis laboriosa TaxID=183418 RepID=UPI001CC38D0A|nr:phospholipase B1, membrane-associated-like [Apis laboriosa]
MIKLRLFFLLQLLYALSMSQKTYLDSPANLERYRLFRNWITRSIGTKQRVIARHEEKIQEEIPTDILFPCNVTDGRSPTIPDSVHHLRPGDIDVIAAMGDSLTAGIGIFATSLLELSIENRGASFTIGGEKSWRTYLTLPNIFKEFNPKLIGYALGDDQTSEPASQLNVAEISAMSRDMPFMAKYLINKMKRDTRINIKKHWKFISLLIGANDFCTNICTVSPWSILEEHRIDLINTFRILRDNLPRTLISLVIVPHLKELVITRKGRNSLKCYIMTTFECSCLFALQFRDRRQEYYEIISRWQKLQEEVANYPEFNRKDFTIIVSSGISNIKIPLAEDGFSDLSYFSVDCFHISQKTNAVFANALWNNLLQPIGNKTTTWIPVFETFLCPTSEKPYLLTRENSQIEQ